MDGKIKNRIKFVKGMVVMEETLELDNEELKRLTPEELVDLKFELEDMSNEIKEILEDLEEE